MNPGNDHATSYSFLDRVALLLGRGPLREGTNGVQGKETAGVVPLESPAKTAPAPSPDLNLDVATVLSPSQCGTFMDCEAEWYFKHFLGLPDVKDAKRAQGSAMHRAIEANFRQKMETKQDLDREKFLGIYAAAWAEESIDARFPEDESREEIERTGAVLAQKYLMEKAPEIQPVAVEHRVTGEIGGVRVQGYVDLMDTNGKIIDLKKAARKPSDIRPRHIFQMATYAELVPGASGQVEIHSLIPTKTPQLVCQKHTVTEADRTHLVVMYPLIQEQMRSGLYRPNRESWFCSRTSCAYWQRCETEFGGTVKG